MKNQITNDERNAMFSVTLNYNQWRSVEDAIRYAAQRRESLFSKLEAQGKMTEEIKNNFEPFLEADRRMSKIAGLILETVGGDRSMNYTICLENHYWLGVIGCISDAGHSRRELLYKLQNEEVSEQYKDNIDFLTEIEEEAQKIITAIKNRVPVVAHYVVVLDWAKDDTGEEGVSLLGVAHSLPEAKKIFSEHIDEERAYADNCGWDVDSDTDTDFYAGEDGSYIVNHTHLYIEEVK